MRKIKAWSLTIVWDDDEVENNVDVPYYASKVIDEFLDGQEKVIVQATQRSVLDIRRTDLLSGSPSGNLRTGSGYL